VYERVCEQREGRERKKERKRKVWLRSFLLFVFVLIVAVVCLFCLLYLKRGKQKRKMGVVQRERKRLASLGGKNKCKEKRNKIK
jgi:hypothetical protein